jgi:hypothetical protein
MGCVYHKRVVHWYGYTEKIYTASSGQCCLALYLGKIFQRRFPTCEGSANSHTYRSNKMPLTHLLPLLDEFWHGQHGLSPLLHPGGQDSQHQHNFVGQHRFVVGAAGSNRGVQQRTSLPAASRACDP